MGPSSRQGQYFNLSSSTVRRYHDQGNCYKRKHLIGGIAYHFRGLVHYHYDGEHGSMQVRTMVENYIIIHRQRDSGLGMAF